MEIIVDRLKSEVSDSLRKERVQMYDGLPQRARKNLMSLDNALIDQSLQLQTVRRQKRKLTDFGGLPQQGTVLHQLTEIAAEVSQMRRKRSTAEEQIEYRYDFERACEGEFLDLGGQ